MPLDPIDAKRLADLEQSVGSLVENTGKLTQRSIALNARLRVVEGRNKALWTPSGTLFLALLGSVLTSVYKGGTVDANQASQAKQIEALNASHRDIERALRESTTGRKAEPAK